MQTPRFITSIGQLAQTLPSPSGLPLDPVRIIRDTWIEIEHGRVASVGPSGQSHPISYDPDAAFDAKGMLVTPGFVDAHTHPVFVHTRQREFVRRCLGESYTEIAAEGGGILSTVKGVREADEAALAALVELRCRRFLALGTTTIEAKSGYGLTVEAELKSLRALRTVGGRIPLTITTTLLGAHTVPMEYRDHADDYARLVCDEMIPRAADENLADAVDVFLEDGAFNLRQARLVFEAARDAGLRVRLHADQFTAKGGAMLAAEFNALSADHMDNTDDAGIAAIADAGVTVTLLPGPVFFLGLENYARARYMIQRGCRIALATDFNPGSSPTKSMPLMMTLACVKMGLTPSEALWAATMGGGCACAVEERVGSLRPGYDADLCIWDAEDLDALPYSYGDMIPKAVFKGGTLVAEDGIPNMTVGRGGINDAG